MSSSSIVFSVKLPFTGRLNNFLKRRKKARETARELEYSWHGKIDMGEHATMKELRDLPKKIKDGIVKPLKHHQLYHEIRTFVASLPYHMLPPKGRSVRLWKMYDGAPMIYIDQLQGLKEEWLIDILKELDNRGFVVRRVDTSATETGGCKDYRLQRGKVQKLTVSANLAYKPDNCEMVQIGSKIVPEYDLLCKDNDEGETE